MGQATTRRTSSYFSMAYCLVRFVNQTHSLLQSTYCSVNPAGKKFAVWVPKPRGHVIVVSSSQTCWPVSFGTRIATPRGP